MKRLAVILGILVGVQGQALAQCKSEPLAPDSEQLLSRQLADKQPLPDADGKLQIGSIRFIQNNIFDTDLPSEDNWLFHLANNMHIMTEPQVLKNILLFSEGDLYTPELLRESERLLRQQGYLYDAQISATKRCEESVDVVITTRELWTLLPEISFSRSGGENRSTFGFRDSNFLGWGKRLSLVRTNDDERNGYEFTYADPNIFGSRYQGRLEYADNSDGERHWLSLSYPFYSLDTPYSYGFAYGSNKRDEKLYDKGETISEFSQDTSNSEVFFGIARRPAEHWTQRIRFGYRYHKERFYELPETYAPIATERTLSYPYIDISWFEDDFVKVHNIDTISRTEDLNLGWQIHTQLGYSPSSLSDDASRYVVKLNVARSHYISQQSLWRWSLGIDGTIREQDFDAENLFFGAQAEYLFNSDDAQSWYVKAQVDAAEGLTADKQLPLGGDSGLRGYPHHYDLGDRRALFSVEKRYYWQYNLWQLFSVGGAFFYDAGQAWFHDNQDNAHFRHNIGFGLRLAPSRANAGAVIHLDVARPINRSDDVDPLQWLVSVKKTF
ncbi:POTRA domain-containing protein [Pseudoalteromonas sp. YIC-827]|uniref:POTRA domain-containing protein n=1 Tax=Pseudoalteromonas qingdaonensis TaxID=3131913 RepID=A0ABU9MWY3_9GAMM